jgi:hypothetical protein
MSPLNPIVLAAAIIRGNVALRSWPTLNTTNDTLYYNFYPCKSFGALQLPSPAKILQQKLEACYKQQ